MANSRGKGCQLAFEEPDDALLRVFGLCAGSLLAHQRKRFVPKCAVGRGLGGDFPNIVIDRKLVGKAPLSETLAAALIQLTPWHADRILVDPFCGSGTFPIEAALIGANIAPGMNRSFTAENWRSVAPKKAWYNAGEEANDLVRRDVEMSIQGYDCDGEIIKAAMQNARMAGVEKYIHFQQRDVADLRHPKKYGFILTNPPYGERLEDRKALPEIYKTMGESFGRLDSWSWYILTAYGDAEKYIGRKADRNRKIYNGMIKTYFYQFMGPKPPARKAAGAAGARQPERHE